MGILAIILIIIGAIVLLPGLFFKAVGFLIWVGIGLAVVAAILALIRYISGRNRV